MFLRLRWNGIDVEPYRMRTINALLSKEAYDYLKEMSGQTGAPHSEIFRQAIDRLRLRSSGALKLLYHKPEMGERIRICLRLRSGQIKFLKDMWKAEGSMGDCLSYVIRGYGHLVSEVKRHKRITLGVRMEDYGMLAEFQRRYNRKYHEKLRKSEVFHFAYFSLFKHMKGLKQKKYLRCEKIEGKQRGCFKKISISLPYSTKGEPKISDLRAALYYLLRSQQLEAFLG
jgi:hypothetical protein